MFMSHMNLVKNMASRFGKLKTLDYDDLFQAGCIGLMEAIKRYDDKSGNKLSSYAYKYIEGYILQEIRDNDNPVTISAAAIDIAKDYRDKYEIQGIGVDEYAKTYGHKPYTVSQALNATKRVTYLNSYISINEEDEAALIDLMTYDNIPDEVAILYRELKKDIGAAMDEALNERQKFMLKSYYYDGNTYEQIGKIVGVARNRSHTIINNAIRKMRLFLYKSGRVPDMKYALEVINRYGLEEDGDE